MTEYASAIAEGFKDAFRYAWLTVAFVILVMLSPLVFVFSWVLDHADFRRGEK